MNRVIILDGPDGSGKTTLANTLAKDHGFKVVHTGVPDPSLDSQGLFNQYVDSLDEALHNDQPVVFDRHYLGECIYGPIMRGKSLLSPMQIKLIERVCRARDVKVVICCPRWETVYANWQVKKNDYVTKPIQLKDIYDCYADFAMPSGPSQYECFNYEFAKPDGHLRLLSPGPTLPTGVIGSPQAKYLLVGERTNQRVHHRDWAFFSDQGSSQFLNEALDDVPEADLAFVNAIDVAGEFRDFYQVVNRMPKLQTIVALGSSAHVVLNTQAIRHVQLPHPAYWKRFHADDTTYPTQLKEAMCI